MAPLRVLHITDKLSLDGKNPSSPTILIGEWLTHADPRRVRMKVFSLRPPEPAGAYLRSMGVQPNYFYLGPFDARNVGAIRRAIAIERPHIIHLHGLSSANFGRIASRLAGVWNIIHEHAECYLPPHQTIADRALRRLTDAAIAVSSNVKDFMVKKRFIPAEKIDVLANGVQVERFRFSAASRTRMRAALGVDDGTPVIGTVTRLRQEKGVNHFLKAAALIGEKVPNARFVVVGSGPLRQQLEEQARSLGLRRRVSFLGFRSDIPEILSALDIHVISSLTEGCPLSMLEAMAAGNVIVATAVGGMRDIARETEAAALVKPADPEAIARRTIHLLDHRPLARDLGRRAAQAASAYSSRHSAERLVNFYERLVGNSSPVAALPQMP